MSTVSKYWDKYRERHKSIESTPKNTENSTDKKAYITHLESQIDKVSQNSISSQTVNDQIEALQGALKINEEKIINLTRLVKLQQNYAENQEDDLNTLKKRVEVIANNEGYHSTKLSDIRSNLHVDSGKMQELEKRIEELEDFLTSEKSNEKIKNSEEKLLKIIMKVKEENDERHKEMKGIIEQAMDCIKSDLFEESKGTSSFGVHDLESSGSFDSFKRFIDKEFDKKEHEIKNLAESLWKSEKNCIKLVEECAIKINDCEKSIKDLGKIIENNCQDLKKIERGHFDIEEIELKITTKVNTTVEKIAELVKKYLRSQQELQIEVKNLSSKISNIDSQSNGPDSPRFKTPDELKINKPKPPLSPLSKTLKDLEDSAPQEDFPAKKRNLSQDFEQPQAPKDRRSQSPHTPRSNSEISPKATAKSLAMDQSIKKKLREIKEKEAEDSKFNKKYQKDSKLDKKKKKLSKLEKVYQQLSNRD
ncbi:unnamed protein product [Blepharisma stoltei]|uniref:Uncharacterized protein n=1 Tax=Blepharisma stoltei TaxID=1481888 RepID=A0AAU9K2P9_9CILI|nr:unnamed protein product [Blepharisma stoltei]